MRSGISCGTPSRCAHPAGGGSRAVQDGDLTHKLPPPLPFTPPKPQLLHKFVGSHVHRLYVVDKDATPRPLAILTLTDVLRLVAGVW